MSTKKKLTGLIIASAAAVAFAAAPVTSALAAKHMANNNVKCVGGNACKGKSACKTAKSSCKGHNSCKGKGFVMTTKASCDKAGGKVGK